MAADALVQTSIRRRLLGLAALLVISLAIAPLIFDAAGYKERKIVDRIPPMPSLPPVVEMTPIQSPQIDEPTEVTPVNTEPASLSEPVVVKAPPAVMVDAMKSKLPAEISPAEDMPRLDENGIPAAWSLQLASFRDERNAKSLRSDLTKSGYKVYIRRSNDLVRVYIGPEMQRSRLETLKETIKEKYSLDGMIVRFTTQ